MKRAPFFFEKLDAPEAEKEVKRLFSRVLGTDEGKIVLTMILEDLYYFDVAATPEQVALKNYATMLLRKLGDLDNYGATSALLAAIKTQEP